MHESIRLLTREDLPHLRDFWIQHWGSDVIVVHGDVVGYDEVEGFAFEDWDGLLTFRILGNACEIISLNSLRNNAGIGTALIDVIIKESKTRKLERIWVITTNDNLNALGFYQKRGFELSALHRGAINESRKIKPSIPLMGENNIPLRDEIELEMKL